MKARKITIRENPHEQPALNRSLLYTKGVRGVCCADCLVAIARQGYRLRGHKRRSASTTVIVSASVVKSRSWSVGSGESVRSSRDA
jgi:hypothetical protein